MKNLLHTRKSALLMLMLSVCTFTAFAQLINTNRKLTIDTANCYIIDNFRATTWGNTAGTVLPGYGTIGTANVISWLGAASAIQQPALYNGTQAMLSGSGLNYTLLNCRPGNYDNFLGMLNLKDLYLSGNSAEQYSPFAETHVQSYLQLPTLPSVGKMILFVLKAYGSTGFVVESKQTNSTWMEVARVSYPVSDTYISLDTVAGNSIISQTPVTYRIRATSYNSTTSNGSGPVFGALLVQKYIDNDVRPPYRPYFFASTDVANITYAESVVNSFSEAQWLSFVPTQAPRSLQFSPANTAEDTWTWSTSTPDQIKDGNGVVFPNASYPPSYASVTVMSGKTISVPYHNTSKGWTFVQAQIDYQKMRYISSKMYNLGAAYYLTKNEKYARYVALAMDKLANVVPDFFMTQGWNVNKLVNVSEINSYRNIGGFLQRASDHNGITYEMDDYSIQAFDFIYESAALKTLTTQKGYDVRKHIENDLFLNEALWLKDQPSMEDHLSTNLPKYAENMLEAAAICSDASAKVSIPDFVDRYLQLIISRNFKRDGMYPESFGYHKGYANDSYTTVKVVDKYFKLFPPTTQAATDIASRTASRLIAVKRSVDVKDSVSFPDGDLVPFDDTDAGGATVRSATKSYLLPAYQHAMLGDGTGSQQIQTNMGAHDMANHMGSSILHMTLFANGEEQLGDIRYSRIPGRWFTRSTVSHNLVIVDQGNDQYNSNAQVYGNSKHVFTNGYFTMFEPSIKGVSATEAYSTTTKPGLVTRYQRLQVLNTIDISKPYLIDVFVVNGGTTHEYFLNGSTQIDQTATCSLPLVAINSTYPMLPAGQTYTDPVNELDTRNWYGALRQTSSAPSNGNWNAVFQGSTGGGVKIFAIDDATPTVFLGKSPHGYRRTLTTSMYTYWRPMLVERRIGTGPASKNIFIHIIEPYSSTSNIASVTKLPLVNASAEYLALSILFNNGRKDVALINLNNDLITGTAATQTIQTSDQVYSLTGKIGVFSTANGTTNGYLFQGSNLTFNSQKLDLANATYTGTITGAVRKLDGAAYNALITDAVIPEGDELKGKWISVRFGTYSVISAPSGFSTQSNINELFRIDGVRIIGGKTYLLTDADHQLSINGNVATELVRPQRVFNGAVTFKIQKSSSADLTNLTTNVEIRSPKVKADIFPNPASDKINIVSEFEMKSIEILNPSSVLIKSINNLNGNQNIELSVADLPSGVYLCKVTFTNNMSDIVKVIITK